jgi:hypothetical protein
LGAPRAAAAASCGLLDRLSTYSATSDTSAGVPTAAAIVGIVPTRPCVMVSRIASCVPPCSQSSSVRFGKPLLPRASEPWQAAQLLMNRRSPIAIAPLSRASSGKGVAAYLA